MPIIDADTHIDETEDTWEYMQKEDLQYKPTTTSPSNPDPTRPPIRYWLIDGKRQIRFGCQNFKNRANAASEMIAATTSTNHGP